MDDADPLAPLRARFVGTNEPVVYLDGNSLGRPLTVTGERMRTFVDDEWGGRLIRGWDESWFDLPLSLGDELGRVCLGAAPGQVAVGDSTTVLLYKLMRTAVAARPGRTEIVIDRDNFPTDRYLAMGVAEECGLTLRWLDVDTAAGTTVDQVAAAVGEQTALVALSHVSYRSSWVADVPAITRVAHDAGALVLWDLCHSAGAIEVDLEAAGVDVAVGCTYKYLNGGPGAPAFLYVRRSLQAELRNPIQGWFGQRDLFAMAQGYDPAPGIGQWLTGTTGVVAIAAVEEGVRLTAEAGIGPIRAKGVALTEFAIQLVDGRLAALGCSVGSPRDADRRGDHVAIRHPDAKRLTGALIERGVLPDFREPDSIRFGLSPLTTSFTDVARGVAALESLLA